jgi:hypothetical protein
MGPRVKTLGSYRCPLLFLFASSTGIPHLWIVGPLPSALILRYVHIMIKVLSPICLNCSLKHRAIFVKTAVNCWWSKNKDSYYLGTNNWYI